jgi:hypothetical protein
MISEWTSQLDRLNTVAETQPHFAYAALTHGVLSKLTYFFRTTSDVSKFIDPLEEFLKVKLIPTLTGQTAINNNKYSLLSLPVRFGGMGILNLSAESTSQYNSSLYINFPIINSLVQNPSETPLCMLDLLEEV